MSLKRIKFEDTESFKKKVLEEFLPTLPHALPCQIVGYNFNKGDTCCTLQLLTQEGMKTYSVYLDANTGYAEYCTGKIGQYPAKDIN